MKSKPYHRIESHLSPADGRISVLWLHTNVKCEFSADHHGRIDVGLHCGQMLVHTLERKVKELKNISGVKNNKCISNYVNICM